MGDRLTRGLALPVLRKVYHERRNAMPPGWVAEWRSNSMTVYTPETDVMELFRKVREFEGGSGGYEHIASLKRMDMEIGMTGESLHVKYSF